MPSNIAVTANLTIDYRKPVPVDSYVVLSTQTQSLVGRKAHVTGTIKILSENGDQDSMPTSADLSGIFVEPKYASSMKVGKSLFLVYHLYPFLFYLFFCYDKISFFLNSFSF